MAVKKVLVVFLIVFFPKILLSFEEPIKTLQEKQEKSLLRSTYKRLKVKIAKAKRYEVVDGVPTENVLERIEKEFDLEGRLVVFRKFTGLVIEKESHYKYDQNSNLIKEVIRSGDGKIVEETNYKYDSEGRIISAESRDGKGKLTAIYEYSYSKDKKFINAKKFDGEKILLNTIEYIYPRDFDKDKCYEMNILDDGNNLVSKLVFNYDAKGNLAEKINYGKENKEKDRLYYSYDENNNITQIKRISSNKSVIGYENRGYNNNGLNTEIKILSGENQITSLIRIEYETYQ